MDPLDLPDAAPGESPTPTDEVRTLEEWRLLGRPEGLALEIDAGQSLDGEYGDLARARRIVLQFPVFMDGRGFSHARQLRAAGFEGELLAGGDVLADQWVYLRRCGFSGLASDAVSAVASTLPTFTRAYQS